MYPFIKTKAILHIHVYTLNRVMLYTPITSFLYKEEEEEEEMNFIETHDSYKKL